VNTRAGMQSAKLSELNQSTDANAHLQDFLHVSGPWPLCLSKI